MQGRIIKHISSNYTVEAKNKKYVCRARGLFRKEGVKPLVGDYVEFNEKEKYLLKVLPRKNELERPSIANIDKCIVVTSCKKPDFSSLLLDKMLTNVILSSIDPVIVFTKYDLLKKSEREYYDDLIAYYNSIGIPTFKNTELDKLEECISESIVTVTGQTGSGKSSLINQLDPKLKLKTDEISASLGRGKHTTRHVELYKVKDYYIADTPGFSALDVVVDKENIRYAFYEFHNELCKFNDCQHINEIGCNVLDEVENGTILASRYENYRDMVLK